MQLLGDVKRHFLLVKRMARATGADLEGAVQSGRLSESDWAETITRCRGCTCVDACETWLRVGELADMPPRDAPLHCENRDLFRGLTMEAAD